MKILFACYANSARSQLAEAYCRYRAPHWKVESGGLRRAGVHHHARRALSAWGIEDRSLHSEVLDAAAERGPFDIVVSLDDRLKQPCDQISPGARREHWPILDPTGVGRTEAEKDELFLFCLQDIADEIDALLLKVEPKHDFRPRPVS